VHLLLLLLAACETVESAPRPTPIVPLPVDAAPAPVDAADPPAVANLDCYVSGGKEYTRIKTDPATLTGVLDTLTTGPVPSRHIKYKVRAEGPGTYALVFDGYAPGDYQWIMRNPPRIKPRETIVVGKSIVARVFLRGSHTFMVGVDVDLAAFNRRQWPANEMPCWEKR